MAVNLSPTFFRNLEAYESGTRIIINQGGQGSGKTYSILQLLYMIGTLEEKRISVCSYALPHLKEGAMADFERILRDFGRVPADIKNISESTYSLGKSRINFFGIEGNVARAHSVRRDILYIVEANRRVGYEVFDQLASRTQGVVFMCFNPDQEFWLHDKVIPNFKHKLIISTYLDNPFLPSGELENILSKKDKPGFENWWKVYGLGQLGKLEGAIFMNWHYGEFPNDLPYRHGLDFGFTAPDAMLKCAIDEKAKRIYWDERFYKSGNSIDDLKQLIGEHCRSHERIIGDSAEARLIREMRKKFNIHPANKQKYTVAESIKMMQSYEIIITPESYNLAKELNNYIWSDKKAGIPVDAFNHLIDAGRYCFIDNLTGGHPGGTWHNPR